MTSLDASAKPSNHRRFPSPKLLVFVGVLVLLVGGGVIARHAYLQAVQETYRDTVPFGTVVETLQVSLDSGRVEVLADRASGAAVERVLTWSGGARPETAHEIDGTELRIGGCMSGNGCSVSYVIHVPAATGIAVTAQSGAITVNGTSRPIEIHTESADVRVMNVAATVAVTSESGDVLLDDVDGTVAVTTEAGDVAGQKLQGGTITAVSQSGEVIMDFDIAPTNVNARTDNGDIAIRVPIGDAYQTTSVTDGDVDSELTKEDKSARAITAISESGDISLGYN